MSDDRDQVSEVRLAGAVRGFEDLEVFKRAYRISLEVHRTSLSFPGLEQGALGDQVRRASKSICGNIAEGFGKQRQSAAEFKRFLLMAMGSADEMRAWARYCLDLGYIEDAQWRHWRDEYQEIARMLQGLCAKTTREKKAGSGRRSDP
jgi:four helix bundle protein